MYFFAFESSIALEIAEDKSRAGVKLREGDKIASRYTRHGNEFFAMKTSFRIVVVSFVKKRASFG